jgi:hypothetical protein
VVVTAAGDREAWVTEALDVVPVHSALPPIIPTRTG